MGYVQVELTEDVKAVINRHIAKGRAVSEADFVAEAVRPRADHLDAGNGVAGMVRRADADIVAGCYVVISTQRKPRRCTSAPWTASGPI